MRSDREKKKQADAKAARHAQDRACARDGARVSRSASSLANSQARPSSAGSPVRPRAPQSPSHAHTRDGAQPVLRLRMMLIGLCVLVVGIAGPLVLVWKQSYINQVSMRLENRAVELKSLKGEITSLQLESVRLSASARIERLSAARGFEYPPSSRMEILEVEPPGRSGGGVGEFFAYVKRVVLGERG